MSASLRTKDGSASVVGAILASEKAASRYVPIDMEGALAWAQDNAMNLKGVRRPLDRINARRVELSLPPFKTTRSVSRIPRPTNPVSAPKTVPPRPLVSSEDDLLKRILTYHGTVTGLVTPQIAEWLLKLNTANRPIVRRAIERFCKILSDGAWVNTGEPVIVSHEAVLNDGQHRLTAILTSGIAAELDVRFGIPREAFHATGTGTARRAGQVLSIEGYSNTSCQASIARLLIHYDKEQMGNRTLVEIGEILRAVDADDCICEIAAKIQRSKFGAIRTGSFGFALVVAARTAPISRVFEFADLVASGMFQSEDESEPTRRLYVKFRDAAMKRDRIHQVDVAILTVKAWNGWVRGDAMPPLKVLETERTNGGFPKVEVWRERQALAA